MAVFAGVLDHIDAEISRQESLLLQGRPAAPNDPATTAWRGLLLRAYQSCPSSIAHRDPAGPILGAALVQASLHGAVTSRRLWAIAAHVVRARMVPQRDWRALHDVPALHSLARMLRGAGLSVGFLDARHHVPGWLALLVHMRRVHGPAVTADRLLNGDYNGSDALRNLSAAAGQMLCDYAERLGRGTIASFPRASAAGDAMAGRLSVAPAAGSPASCPASRIATASGSTAHTASSSAITICIGDTDEKCARSRNRDADAHGSATSEPPSATIDIFGDAGATTRTRRPALWRQIDVRLRVFDFPPAS